MNREQGVKQKTRTQKFMESNKLRPLFHELTKLLLLRKPADPIQFLIDYLDKRNKRQIVCINGFDEESRVKLSKNIGNKFNYKVIQLSQIYKGSTDWNSKEDKQINEKVMTELHKVQSVYKGVIISGYPNNIVQTDFIQKSGILPQRYFLMANNQELMRKLYQTKYQGDIQKVVQRNRLQLKQLHQILGDQIDYLPSEFQRATQKIIQTLSIKASKKAVPYDSLRVLVLYPPYLRPQGGQVFVDTFSLNPIQVGEILKKLANKQAFITHVQSYIRKHKCISKEIQLAMIETITKNATSRNKGFALYGWPSRKDRLPLLKQHFLKPHLIMVFDLSKQKSLDKFSALNPDDAALFAIIKKPSNQQYSQIYDQYQELIEELKGKNNVHVFNHGQTADKVAKTFVNLVENPKIYS